MQFAINVPNFDCFSDVGLMAELVHEANFIFHEPDAE